MLTLLFILSVFSMILHSEYGMLLKVQVNCRFLLSFFREIHKRCHAKERVSTWSVKSAWYKEPLVFYTFDCHNCLTLLGIKIHLNFNEIVEQLHVNYYFRRIDIRDKRPLRLYQSKVSAMWAFLEWFYWTKITDMSFNNFNLQCSSLRGH